jgi:predicted metal-dependent phosphoesterase TrpH
LTDHETVGAFHLDDGAITSLAAGQGIQLIAGIEIDAEIRGHEVHVLGHFLDPGNPPLLDHCHKVQTARRQRTAEELEQVNERLGGVIAHDDVFVGPRETYMRPNLILPLLDRQVFPSYGAAARWFRENIRPATKISRLTVPEAIDLIHQAGGRAALAHPAYGLVEGWLELEGDLADFRAAGLDAVEVDYPYAVCSPDLFDEAKEAAMIVRIQAAASANGLEATKGSDCHRQADFPVRWALRQ